MTSVSVTSTTDGTRQARIFDSLAENTFDPIDQLQRKDVNEDLISDAVRTHLVYIFYTRAYAPETEAIAEGGGQESFLIAKHSICMMKIRKYIVNAHTFAITKKLSNAQSSTAEGPLATIADQSATNAAPTPPTPVNVADTLLISRAADAA